LLNLRLRDEFLGQQTPGTTIALRRPDNSGVAQQAAEQILNITYPTADVQTALKSLGTDLSGRPIVLIGDRGRGKSHIMGVMHHAIASPDAVEAWAADWGRRLSSPALQNVRLKRGYFPISEPVHNHEFPLLWELLFARHPQGQLFKGRFESLNQPYPPRRLLEEMFAAQPVALILDEFQKWFDGLHDDPPPHGRKWREVASNFIQNLSEIAAERPELLVLVVSVLNNNTDAFQQVHRNTPILINFQGPTAKRDRQQLLLHRLFTNRANIPSDETARLVDAYATERFRLRFATLPASEQERKREEVLTLWPFSPELIELLDDQILMAEAAQESRDLIRILAAVFRGRGEQAAILTPADFLVDDDACGVQALIASIATAGEQEELLQIAQRNLEGVLSQGLPLSHARELLSALWMRSMSPGRHAGGTRQDLQLDITRDQAISDNAFRDELMLIKDNSINIHGADDLQGRLWIGRGENAKTKVRATARNNRLWEPGAPSSSGTASIYPGKDTEHIRNTIRHILVPETREAVSRVVVLGPQWMTDPWPFVDENDRPERWSQPVLLVVPNAIDAAGGGAEAQLGKWLAQHVPSKRNTVRFLLPVAGAAGIYEDRDIVFSARCSYLTSQAWRDDPQYYGLRNDFDRPLRETLKARFDRLAVLSTWNFRQPEQCRFDIERVDGQLVREKGAIPLAIDEQIKRDLFDPAEFQTLVIDYARNNREVSRLVDDLKEPPPSGDAIPFLGETGICEEVLKVASKGRVVLNVSGQWIGRLPEHADDDDALRFIRSRAFRNAQEMRQVQLALPGAAGSGAVTGPTPAVTPTQPTTPTTGPQPGLWPTGGTTTGPTTPPVTPTGLGGGPTPPGATTPTSPQAQTHRTQAPTTVINLVGSFEQWGVPSDAALKKAQIEFEGLTVQQIKQILQRIPSTFRANLEITYDRNERNDQA